jgi:radical SAM protein with 4Fe4S-binding SPASM domain
MRPALVYSKYAYYIKEFGSIPKLKNILINKREKALKSVVLKSKPYQITIDPGNVCNLRCPGCHTGIKHHEMIQPGMLTFNNFKTIFNQLEKYAFSIALYNWGEPLLNKQIFSMIDYAKTHCVGTNIHSNLNILTEQMAIDLVKSGLTHLYLSIDGATQENYVKYRVKGDYNKVLENLSMLTETKKKLGSKYPLITWKFLEFEHNVHEVEDAKKQAIKSGVNNFETFKAVPKLMDIYDEANEYEKDPQRLQHLNKICHSLWSSIYVNSDGSVLACSLSFREKEVFGNLLQNSLPEIWNNEKYVNARQMFKPVKNPDKVPMPCKGCKYYLKECG